jgi:sRNA-binding regulator protein Hfq
MYMICVLFSQPRAISKVETLVRIYFINKHTCKAVIISYIINYNVFIRLHKSAELIFRGAIQKFTNCQQQKKKKEIELSMFSLQDLRVH